MIALPEKPALTTPHSRVKTSYLVGEQADMVHRGSGTDWLADASRDFDGFVADRLAAAVPYGAHAAVR